ncbi:2'-5' RNA ligase family protein [Priestia taiwanensis]|uniref:2'-5' RNA ligase family protein n=1 Tax=Priestia taiwanensis TaxID=1347902 RepID=A0A917AQ14_9BACI|nr:2'-5' RNA ligase family protein [Priestia taiwanensis]MBM7363043.1 2'-5' RNA ligase [Priestia taiwanensis]GGE67156.1 hypothetical protein GCM10007140_16640 [Priestia taiwanensis]
MYAVVALFDEKSEAKIEQLSQKLASKRLPIHAQHVKGIRPHVTLATYHKLPLHRIPIYIQTFCQMTRPLPILFSALSSFPPGGTLFLAPTVTIELLNMHTSYHSVCRSFADIEHSLYNPQNWVPHCTLANNLTQRELKDAFAYCSEQFSPIEVTITSIGLVHTTFENGKCVRYQPVIELPLQADSYVYTEKVDART